MCNSRNKYYVSLICIVANTKRNDFTYCQFLALNLKFNFMDYEIPKNIKLTLPHHYCILSVSLIKFFTYISTDISI